MPVLENQVIRGDENNLPVALYLPENYMFSGETSSSTTSVLGGVTSNGGAGKTTAASSSGPDIKWADGKGQKLFRVNTKLVSTIYSQVCILIFLVFVDIFMCKYANFYLIYFYSWNKVINQLPDNIFLLPYLYIWCYIKDFYVFVMFFAWRKWLGYYNWNKCSSIFSTLFLWTLGKTVYKLSKSFKMLYSTLFFVIIIGPTIEQFIFPLAVMRWWSSIRGCWDVTVVEADACCWSWSCC